MLKDSASEVERERRIEDGRPGSPCPKGYLVYDTQFTKVPICPASRGYQKRRLASLTAEKLSDAARSFVKERVLAKTCLCRDLAAAATVKLGIAHIKSSFNNTIIKIGRAHV